MTHTRRTDDARSNPVGGTPTSTHGGSAPASQSDNTTDPPSDTPSSTPTNRAPTSRASISTTPRPYSPDDAAAHADPFTATPADLTPLSGRPGTRHRGESLNGDRPASAMPRRAALKAAGVVGVAGLLAACADDEPGGQGPASSPGGGATRDSDQNAGGGGQSPDDGSDQDAGDDSGSGDALISTDDVPVGGGVILDAHSLVVTQPDEGEFVAFDSTCTHLGCAVAEVADGAINCHCHGSRFSIADGSVEQGPAEEPLAEVEIVVDAGNIRPA